MDDIQAVDGVALIEEIVSEYVGSRCPDFDPSCHCCQAWAAVDKLKNCEKVIAQSVSAERERCAEIAEGTVAKTFDFEAARQKHEDLLIGIFSTRLQVASDIREGI